MMMMTPHKRPTLDCHCTNPENRYRCGHPADTVCSQQVEPNAKGVYVCPDCEAAKYYYEKAQSG